MSLNLDTMVGIAHMHICGTYHPIPRGYAIFKATLQGTDLTLYLRPYFVACLLIAQKVFHLPEEIPGQIFDWAIDQCAHPMKILQQNTDLESLIDVIIEGDY
jgi:hypothetical protein